MVDRRVSRGLYFVGDSLSRYGLEIIGERYLRASKIVGDSSWDNLPLSERERLLSDPEIWKTIERFQEDPKLTGCEVATVYIRTHQPTAVLPVGTLDDTLSYFSSSRNRRFINSD